MGMQSIGNGVAKELIPMTHGHEQWCGDCLHHCGGWYMEGDKGKKNWDNCNT